METVSSVPAEKAVSGRYDPAGGHQGAGAEVQLAHVNGRHPGMRARQSRVPAQNPAPGRQPLRVPLPTDRLVAYPVQGGHLSHGQGGEGIRSPG